MTIEERAINYHRTVEGEYGCNGLTCPGVQRLIKLLRKTELQTLQTVLRQIEEGLKSESYEKSQQAQVYRNVREWSHQEACEAEAMTLAKWAKKAKKLIDAVMHTKLKE